MPAVVLASAHVREWFVAGGTVAASVATAALAAVTWRLVSATKTIAQGTRRQGELTTAALMVQLEPRIVGVPNGPPKRLAEENVGQAGASEEYVQPFVIPIVNAGAGLAIIEQVEVHRTDAGHGERVTFRAYLPSGAQSDVRAVYPLPPRGTTARPPARIPAGHALNLTVRYRGVDDRRYVDQFGWTRRAGRGNWQLSHLSSGGERASISPVAAS
jgi:hypothetical protein